MLKIKSGITACTILILASCALPNNSSGEHQYLKSKNSNKIIVPKPLHADNINELYVIPNKEQHAKLNVDITPPTAKA